MWLKKCFLIRLLRFRGMTVTFPFNPREVPINSITRIIRTKNLITLSIKTHCRQMSTVRADIYALKNQL